MLTGIPHRTFWMTSYYVHDVSVSHIFLKTRYTLSTFSCHKTRVAMNKVPEVHLQAF